MTAPIAQGPVDVNVRPVAWLHDQPERYDVVHDKARALWLKAWPKQVEHYTIPLYRHERREPLTTEAACTLLKDALGIDPLLDGNMLKMLRAVERAHGIGPNVELTGAGTASGLNERLYVMTPDTMQDLTNWLCRHEDDIKHGINDFGELQQVFFEVAGRNAGDVVESEPTW